MTAEPRVTLDALLRNDLAAFTHRTFQTVVPGQQFLPNWHVEAIAHHLERIRRREIQRLLITLPPRNLKSICASVAFPAFALGHDPTLRVVCASYSQELAAKHARDCRAVLESAWYKRIFPRTRIDARKNAEGEFETTARGYRLSTSVGGTLTGRGGNLIIIDDPLKPSEAFSEVKRAAANEWFDSTLASRLDRKTEDAIVIVMQRLHIDDLVAHVLGKGGDWVQLNLPAVAEFDQTIATGRDSVYHRRAGELLHPEREPMRVLDDLRASMGSLSYSAQYQQMPVPPGGALVQRSWFRTYRERPAPKQGDRIIQSWDTASKADKRNNYSVCTTWLVRENEFYLLDVLRDRLEFPELRRTAIAHAHRYKARRVLIEDASSGAALIQELRREQGVHQVAIRPSGDKIVRLESVSPVLESGRVLLPERASWLGDFLAEILAFPGGTHDDQVDSLSQFLEWERTHKFQFHISVIS